MTKVDELIIKFDRQINQERKSLNLNKEECPSYWHKLVFLKTLNLDLDDWRNIRKNDYYIVRDSLKGIEKTKFILYRVSDYLRSLE